MSSVPPAAKLPEKTPRGMLSNVRVCPADRKSTRLNSSHANISYAVFCLKKKTNISKVQASMNSTTQPSTYGSNADHAFTNGPIEATTSISTDDDDLADHQ